MKKFFTHYKSSIILICSIIIGGIVGNILKEDAKYLKPIGDIFLNLIFVAIPPFIFFSISSSLSKIKQQGRLNKILFSSIIVFCITSFIAIFFAILSIYIFNPIRDFKFPQNIETVKDVASLAEPSFFKFYEKIANIVTTNDFYLLFSKNNILPLIIFAFIVGMVCSKKIDKDNYFIKFLKSGNVVMTEVIIFITKFAPIGLGCYFAYIVSQMGIGVFQSYKNIFLVYLGLALFIYFVLYSLYALYSDKLTGFKNFWGNIFTPTAVALATCSSMAAIPANIISAKKMKISDDVADCVIPIGTNIHKEGSIIGCVFKVAFLFFLSGQNLFTPTNLALVFVLSLIGALIVNAIPVGGFVAEMVLISILGLSPDLLPLVIVISTIIDAPSTILNSVGNTICAMLVDKLVKNK